MASPQQGVMTENLGKGMRFLPPGPRQVNPAGDSGLPGSQAKAFPCLSKTTARTWQGLLHSPGLGITGPTRELARAACLFRIRNKPRGHVLNDW